MRDQEKALTTNTRLPSTIDFAGAGLSGLCFLHCLALPVLAGLSPIAAAWADAEWAHKAFVMMAIPISGYAAFVREVRFRDRAFVFFVTFGLALLIAAAFAESLHNVEKPLTAAGALILASSHLWRWRRHYEPQHTTAEEDYADKT